MAARDSNADSGVEERAHLFLDVDGTLTEVDTGEELFIQAGECGRGEYFDIMAETHAPGRNEPEEGRGNELLLTLDGRDDVSELERVARNLDAELKPGLEAAVKDFSENRYPVVAHSAGWQPAIDAITNGYFDEKIAGELTEEGPVLNGRYQKPVRMQNYLVEQGIEPVEAEIVFVGDSNTDQEAIRYAAASQGYGAAVSDTVESANERVGEASVYVGSPAGDYAAALLHEMTSDASTEEFVDQYGLDISAGDAAVGELAYDDASRIQEAIETLEVLK